MDAHARLTTTNVEKRLHEEKARQRRNERTRENGSLTIDVCNDMFRWLFVAVN
jgi:hypothetical protein